MRVSFSHIKLALVVGIYGGMPYDSDGNEVLLGDVVISQALIRDDFWKAIPGGVQEEDRCTRHSWPTPSGDPSHPGQTRNESLSVKDVKGYRYIPRGFGEEVAEDEGSSSGE